MRHHLLLLLLALAACDGASVAGPPLVTTAHYFMWGPSNANILGQEGDAPLNAAYGAPDRVLDVAPTATWGGRWLMQAGDDGTACGDFSPRSPGECYDRAVDLTREALSGVAASGRGVAGGVVWHNGSDQRGIDSLFTQDDYDAEFRALIRAVARDLPGLPFYVIEAGTDYEEEGSAAALTRRFREREAAVCASEPPCRVLSAMTEEVVSEAEAVCGADATCVDAAYFERGGVHWQPRAVEIIMAEAGRTLRRLEG